MEIKLNGAWVQVIFHDDLYFLEGEQVYKFNRLRDLFDFYGV